MKESVIILVSMKDLKNNFLLAAGNLMSEMNLRQLRFTYRACRPPKNKKRIKKIKETGDLRYIYQNKLEKSCFHHDMAYGDFKYLPRRAASDT